MSFDAIGILVYALLAAEIILLLLGAFQGLEARILTIKDHPSGSRCVYATTSQDIKVPRRVSQHHEEERPAEA
jgi:hypothetical protein